MDSEELRARVERQLLDAIDGWRNAQRDVPNRSEAIRRLITLGLASEQQATEADE